jgi:hypothetical protein
MPGHFRDSLNFILAGVLLAMPGQSIAQRYGPRAYGWHGGGYGYRPAYVGGYRPAYVGGYRGYGGYGYYPRYVGYHGYYGYPGYYGHYYNGGWIAVGAALGVLVGSMIPPPYVYPVAYPPPPPPLPPLPPATQQCPDGSTIPAGYYCPAPPAPAPPPVEEPRAAPERG